MASNPKLLQYIEDKIKALIEVRMGNVKEIVVDDALSATSENPVQNKVIKAAIDAASGGGGSVTVDTAMSDTSENPVQNKVIKSYVDGKAVTVDSTLNSTSENPVQNKAIYNAVNPVPERINSTRIENSYADATAVSRLIIYKKGQSAYINFNLAFTSAFPKSAGVVSIAKFDVNLAFAVNVIVASQVVDNSTILVQITTDGIVNVYNGHNVDATGFYRSNIPIILA